MVNCIPLNDEREHERSTQCWCEPDVAWADHDTGIPYPNGPSIIHHAADGREACEEITGESLGPGKLWMATLD
jgi:hypothetical protein